MTKYNILPNTPHVKLRWELHSRSDEGSHVIREHDASREHILHDILAQVRGDHHPLDTMPEQGLAKLPGTPEILISIRLVEERHLPALRRDSFKAT